MYKEADIWLNSATTCFRQFKKFKYGNQLQMAISDSQIQELRDRSDIVALIGQRVKLRKSGKDFQGLCPLHGERTPSFYVIPDKNIFHCFGCGQSGDVFRFFMETEGMSFIEALRFVARESGIILSEEEEDPEAIRRRQHEDKLAALMERAVRYYEKKLWSASAQEAQHFLQKRGISESTARQFRLGFGGNSPDELTRALKQAGINPSEAVEAGLCIDGRRGMFDRFSGRLIIPISLPRPPHGKPVALGGRLLRSPPPGRGGMQSAKYINSPETPLYHKGKVLYGLNLARSEIRKAEQAVVVEGYFDAIVLHQAGLKNVVATCGTALTADHLDLLSRMAAKELIFLFDGDAAGMRAATRAAELCAEQQVPSRVATLPDKLDPDDFVRERGLESLQHLLKRAKPAIDLLIDQALDDLGRSPSIEEQAQAVRSVRSIVLCAPEGLSRELYISHIAERLKVAETVVRQVLLEAVPEQGPRLQASSESQRSPRSAGENFSAPREGNRRAAGFSGRRQRVAGQGAAWYGRQNFSQGSGGNEGAGGKDVTGSFSTRQSAVSPRQASASPTSDWNQRSGSQSRDTRNRDTQNRDGQNWNRGDYFPEPRTQAQEATLPALDPAELAARSRPLEEAVIVALLKFPVLSATVAQEGSLGDFYDSALSELGEEIINCRAEGLDVDPSALLATLPLAQAREIREKLMEDAGSLEDYATHLGRVMDRLRLEKQRRQRQASLLALQQGLVPRDPASQSAFTEETQRLLEESRRIHRRIKERGKGS